jgi:hypothetical protein
MKGQMYLSQRCVWHCDGCLTGDETGVEAHIVGKEKHVALRCSVMVAIDMLVTVIEGEGVQGRHLDHHSKLWCEGAQILFYKNLEQI